MKPIARFLLLAIASFFWTFSTAAAQFDDGWWFLEFKDTTGAALQPLNIGIDARDGRGFSFLMLPRRRWRRCDPPAPGAQRRRCWRWAWWS